MVPPDSSVPYRSSGTRDKMVIRMHHVADIFISTTIVSQEVGFKSPIAYVECRGWTIHKMNGKVTLQY
jgi:hypothetical protein